MISVKRFQASHADALIAQGVRSLEGYLTPEQTAAFERSPSFSAIANDSGKVLACAGVVSVWENRSIAWAIFDPTHRDKFIAIHNAVKRFLEDCPARRVEAAVDCEYVAGHRWVRALGFKLEAVRMRAYRPTGGDSALYARVRD
jgi:hypothetical protein